MTAILKIEITFDNLGKTKEIITVPIISDNEQNLIFNAILNIEITDFGVFHIESPSNL